MKEVYVYYEISNINENKSTSVNFEVFANYEIAHKFMIERRDEILVNENYTLDKIETGKDKSWLRVWNNDNYLDLIIEPKQIKE